MSVSVLATHIARHISVSNVYNVGHIAGMWVDRMRVDPVRQFGVLLPGKCARRVARVVQVS